MNINIFSSKKFLVTPDQTDVGSFCPNHQLGPNRHWPFLHPGGVCLSMSASGGTLALKGH